MLQEHQMMRSTRAIFFAVLLGNLCACGSGDSGENTGGFQSVSGFPEVISLGAVWSFGPEDVWISADSGRMVHWNGSEWEVFELEKFEIMLGIWGFSASDVWAVGGATLARFDGTTWETTDLAKLASGIQNLNGIWASSRSDIWVVGSNSTAAHFDGTSWRRYQAAGPDNTAVWGSGPDNVYAASTFRVAHWNGTSWSEIETGEWSSGGESIWGFGPDNVWISDGSELSHFDGSVWQTIELDTMGEPSNLWGNGPDNLWGVGTFGSIFHFNGNQWRQLAVQKMGSPYLRVFHDVHGSEHGDVWIIGGQMGAGGNQLLIYRRDPR